MYSLNGGRVNFREAGGSGDLEEAEGAWEEEK
jgi:hypothetical protein